MTPHVMIDLETLGTTPGSALLSIGAVKFDAETGYIGETFYCNVDLTSSLLAGLTIDPTTVDWWRRQSPEAQSALLRDDRLLLSEALDAFARWLLHGAAWVTSSEAPILWCKGGSFDFPLLTAAYRAAGKAHPWKFWNERDCRTLFKVCEQQHGYKPPKAAGTAHCALDDARHQAEQVIACLRLLRGESAEA